jgi:hypothetical protein
MEVSGQLHASTALPRGKSPRCSLDRRLGGPADPVWTLWKRKKSYTSGNRTRAIQPSLYRLSYPDSSTLKIEEIILCDISVRINQIIWHCIPEDSKFSRHFVRSISISGDLNDVPNGRDKTSDFISYCACFISEKHPSGKPTESENLQVCLWLCSVSWLR